MSDSIGAIWSLGLWALAIYIGYWAYSDPVDLFVTLSADKRSEPLAMWYAERKNTGMDELRKCLKNSGCQLTSGELTELDEWNTFLNEVVEQINLRKKK